MTGSTDAFWNRFSESAGLAEDHPFQAWHFGDSPRMADELTALAKAISARFR